MPFELNTNVYMFKNLKTQMFIWFLLLFVLHINHLWRLFIMMNLHCRFIPDDWIINLYRVYTWLNWHWHCHIFVPGLNLWVCFWMFFIVREREKKMTSCNKNIKAKISPNRNNKMHVCIVQPYCVLSIACASCTLICVRYVLS